ncbi:MULTISPECIES: hypothetical protein [Sphingomonas]|uniref:hypothetical protein n=1 Tax=Sphingomonas TaxID=13687 RepID=UPI000DEEEE2B|nr:MULTISPECIES: hypothetical protein [Sphingomonas]
MTVAGWKLDPAERERLLAEHPPRYAHPDADHVTLKPFGGKPGAVKAAIVGRTDDEQGVEAMVVTIDGSVDRPDGGTYHITWSLADGRQAHESNDVLKERGWQELDHPIPITLTPARF